jgi:hypothetical protein
MNSTISTPFLSQKATATSFLVGRHLLKLFQLVGDCVCIHCFESFLVSTFTNETQVSSPVMMWLRNLSPSLWYCLKKVYKSWSNCQHFVHTHEPNCDNLLQNIAWNLLKFTRKFWNCKALSFTNFLSTLWTRSSLTTDGWLTNWLLIVNICSLIFEPSTLLSYTSFTHFGHKLPRIIQDGFLQHSGFLWDESG